MSICILKNAIDIHAKRIDKLKKFSKKGFPIFNPNEKRIQRTLHKKNVLVRHVAEVLEKHGMMKNRKVGKAVALHSYRGCKRQQWHTDYDPSLLEKCKVKPLGIILAIEPRTYFVTPGVF